MPAPSPRVLVAALCFAAFHGHAAPPPLFLKNCAPCHGDDGSARSPAARKLGVKDLRPSRLIDAQIEKQILDGVLDPRGKPKMPAFRDKFSADELQTLVDAVKALRK